LLDHVTVAKVGKRYGHQRALHGVQLELEAGSACALLGPNGAGKTTLLGILSTLVRATAGEVHYKHAGKALEHGDELRRDIGVLAHASLCYGELDALENLRLFARLYDLDDADARITALLDEVGLEPRARTQPSRTYSRGMVQRLALARALLARPSLLLLDEPFTGLDRGGALTLGRRLAEVKETGAIVLVVTHDLEAIAGLADHVVVLKKGQIAFSDRRPEARGKRDGGFGYQELKDLYHAHADAS
jgi:heme exporter protein A